MGEFKITQGTLLSRRTKQRTLTISPGEATYVLGPKGTLCKVVHIPQGGIEVHEIISQRWNIAMRDRLGKFDVTVGELLFHAVDDQHVQVKTVGITRLPSPLRPRPEEIHRGTCVELFDVVELQQGDILPGKTFVLGEPNSYGTGGEKSGWLKREILFINFSRSSHAIGLFEAARKMRNQFSPQTPHERVQLTFQLYRFLLQVIAPFGDAGGRTGMAVSAGGAVQDENVCRHRAALLQQMMQFSGLTSRYRRLQFNGGGHAVVELDVYGDKSFSYIVDPTLEGGGLWATPLDLPYFFVDQMTDPAKIAAPLGTLYTKEEHVNRVWRPR